MSFILDKTNEATLVTGTKYRFRFSAVNVIGESAQSNEIRIALAD